MATYVGVGLSTDLNSAMAGKQAVETALNNAGINKPDFVFLFVTVGHNQQVVVDAVNQVTGGAALTGCSAEGVISSGEANESNFSVGVMVIASDEITFTHGLEENLKADSLTVGENIAAHVNNCSEEPKALFIFPDGMTINFDQFHAGVKNKIKTDKLLPMFGGAAADNWAAKQTYQYCNSQVTSDATAYALMFGDVDLVWGINHGCIPIGAQRTVTKSKGNSIYEIDGKPILEVLGEYLINEEIGNWERAVVNISIGIPAPNFIKDADEDYQFLITRFMPSSEDIKNGFVTVPTEVPLGVNIWITRRDCEKIADGLDKIADKITTDLAGRKPKMVLHFDCAGRGKTVFRERQKIELVKKLQDSIAPEAPWLGFYTYGEIGAVGGENCFHNYTAVILAIV